MITSVTLVFRALSVYCAENDAYDQGVIVDEYAQFVHPSGTDEPFDLPDFGLTNPFRKPIKFDVVDLNPDRTAVVMFLVRAQGVVRLRVEFNNKSPRDIDFAFDPSDSESVRSFHEVLPGEHLQDGQNTMMVEARTHDEKGSLQISDVVLFYHAKA
jgi:hypothetical protein